MRYVLALLFAFSCTSIFSQDLRAYGFITDEQKALHKVQVTIFESDVPIKTTYSDRKGKFHFRLTEKKEYLILFYKPGFDFYAYKIINHLDESLQNYFMNISMHASQEGFDSLLKKSPIIQQLKSEVISAYLENMYAYTQSSKTHQQALTANALEEQQRFENRTETETKRMAGGKEEFVYRTKIGPDIYERIVDIKNQERFTKNEKPITLSTYTFETKRRYDGVLKRVKKVKNHSIYKPLQK